MRRLVPLFICFLAGLSLVACKETFRLESQNVVKEFSASIADRSKVFLDGQCELSWDESDEISVFGCGANEKYVFTGKTGDNYGTFVKKDPVEPTFSRYYAIYPYSQETECKIEGQVQIILPTYRDFRNGNIPAETNIMAAVTKDVNDDEFVFQNVCGYIKIRLYSETDAVIRDVALTGNNDELLSGQATVTLSADKEPSILMTGGSGDVSIIGGTQEGFAIENGWATIGGGTEELPTGDDKQEFANSGKGLPEQTSPEKEISSKRAIITCGQSGVKVGETAENATDFLFAIPPTTFEKGFSIVVVDELGYAHLKKTTKAITVERSHIVPLAAVRVDEQGGGTEFTAFAVRTNAGTTYTPQYIGEATINIRIPESTDRSNLIAKFTSTGKEVYVGGQKQTSNETVNDFTSPVKYTVVSKSGRTREYTVNVITSPNKSIVCWGDSFTNQNGVAYPARLLELLGDTWTCFNGGIPGDNSIGIATRSGGLKTYLNKAGGFSFPAGTSAVAIDGLTNERGGKVNWSTGTLGVNPCIINGVECKVTSSSVTRTSAGEEVFVPDNTYVEPNGCRITRDADVIVLYMGANGGWSGLDDLIAQHQAIINLMQNKQYIVLASHLDKAKPYSKYNWPTRRAADPAYIKAMDDAFGNHVVYLRSEVNERAEEFLIATGVYKSKDEFSEMDKQYIADGDWPVSFYLSKEDEHPNHAGSKAMATIIFEKMQELGYLE